jgi:hypothetical protein
LWLVAGNPIDGDSFDRAAGAMGAGVEELADFRMFGKARPQPRDEGLGQRIGPELKIGVETGGVSFGERGV